MFLLPASRKMLRQITDTEHVLDSTVPSTTAVNASKTQSGVHLPNSKPIMTIPIAPIISIICKKVFFSKIAIISLDDSFDII